jgi:hypothetical protein
MAAADVDQDRARPHARDQLHPPRRCVFPRSLAGARSTRRWTHNVVERPEPNAEHGQLLVVLPHVGVVGDVSIPRPRAGRAVARAVAPAERRPHVPAASSLQGRGDQAERLPSRAGSTARLMPPPSSPGPRGGAASNSDRVSWVRLRTTSAPATDPTGTGRPGSSQPPGPLVTSERWDGCSKAGPQTSSSTATLVLTPPRQPSRRRARRA